MNTRRATSSRKRATKLTDPIGSAPLYATLTQDLAVRFARIALGHVTREFPHKLDHVLVGPDARGHRELHPIFFGSFDWHSCVHGYWTLARLRRRFPDFAPRAEIDALFARQFTADKVEDECAYFRPESARGFERPYGWAWLLKLASELEEPHRAALSPLADLIVQRFCDFLPRVAYPQRSGSHANTAFALSLAADYDNSDKLARLIADTALRWYGADENSPAWGEPSFDDFLSPTLMEAECLRRVLSTKEFALWLARFLPRLAQGKPGRLFNPVAVSDRTDGKIAHLDGLNLSRAWCWRSLAKELPGEARSRARDAAERCLAVALPHVAGHYMGEHWLASFALLALEA